jgi:hypothetical protein
VVVPQISDITYMYVCGQEKPPPPPDVHLDSGADKGIFHSSGRTLILRYGFGIRYVCNVSAGGIQIPRCSDMFNCRGITLPHPLRKWTGPRRYSWRCLSSPYWVDWHQLHIRSTSWVVEGRVRWK